MGTSHNVTWRFHRVGGQEQLMLHSSEELRSLDMLDPKLWSVLSCPARGLELDAATLALVDSDGDGRIRVPEVLEAVNWLCARLREPAVIVNPEKSLPLSCIDESHESGATLKAAAERLLASLGKAEAGALSMDDLAKALDAAVHNDFNGDGVLPPLESLTPDIRQFIADALAVSGGVRDASGKPGLDARLAEAFVQTLGAWRSWRECLDGLDSSLGENSAEAWDLFLRLKPKIDDYFLRSELVDFMPSACEGTVPDESRKLPSAGGLLDVSDLEEFPIATIVSGRKLSLHSVLNPAWREPLTRFFTVVAPLLQEEGSLSHADWGKICNFFIPYAEIQKQKPAPIAMQVEHPPVATPDSLGLERVEAILNSGVYERFLALAKRDSEASAATSDIAELEKLVRYYLHLHRLLMNFISFHDFYGPKHNATFQAGTLYMDGRACRLCVPVSDVDTHAPLAAYSQLCLLYCECTRKEGNSGPGQKDHMTIAAAMTAGSADLLMERRNGIFVDNEGHDWDATVVKMVSNPISLRQAMLDPYRRFARMVSEQIGKLAGARQKGITDTASTSLESASASPNAAAAGASRFDIGRSVGIFAAIGLALGAIGTAVASIAGALFSLQWWQFPILLAGIFLIISGPALVLAWLKLRKRNLGPLLEASGWAVNGRVNINYFLGRELTSVAAVPQDADRNFRDPLDKPKRWPYIILAIFILAGTLAGWLWLEHREIFPWASEAPITEAKEQEKPPAPATARETAP